jgi:hypothetical protein
MDFASHFHCGSLPIPAFQEVILGNSTLRDCQQDAFRGNKPAFKFTMSMMRQLLFNFALQPVSLLVARVFMKIFGSTLQKERFGVLHRNYYAYGMVRAAKIAKGLGKEKVTVCEFGVAQGRGLLNLIELARQIEPAVGIKFRIVGFDSGTGLPALQGYKDHPELWVPGDFTMDKDALLSRIGNKAEIFFGDIADTVEKFLLTVDASCPIGFCSIDTDFYSSSKSALLSLRGKPESYTPAVSLYFDDVSAFTCNKWCGELASIEEFNVENTLRKIDVDRSLPGGRPVPTVYWYQRMYVGHILDHPLRQAQQNRKALSIGAVAKLSVLGGLD